MHFIFVKQIFVILLILISKISLAEEVVTQKIQCDPAKELELLANLDYYWKQKVEVGESLKISCTRPYGVEVASATRIDSSYQIQCKPDGKFDGIRECINSCDMSAVLKTGLKYDLPATVNKTKSGGISASKLVANGDEVEIKCLNEHYIEELSTPGTSTANVTSFIYKCGAKPENTVYKCTPKKIIFDNSAPPTSNITGNFTPKYNCNLNQLVLTNAKITEVKPNNAVNGAVSSVVNPNTKVSVQCESGFAVNDGVATPIELGTKLNETFQATCDPNGTGKFLNSKACIQRCNATALIKASGSQTQVKDSAFIYDRNLTNSLGTLDNKNVSTNRNKMIDSRTAIKIQCQPGFEIRKTSKDHYYSQCSSTGFSDVEKCEPVITPCNNSDINFDALLQPSKHKYDSVRGSMDGTTAVGSSLDAKCQGGQDPYFVDSIGIPRCIYNESTKQSKWSHTNFKCFDGCIAPNINGEQRKISTGAQAVSFVGKFGWYAKPNCTNDATYYAWEGLNKKYVKPTCLWNLPETLSIAAKNLVGSILSFKNITAYKGIQNYELYSCEQRQTEPKKVAELERVISHSSWLQDSGSGDLGRFYIMFYDGTGGCSGEENNHKKCENYINETYLGTNFLQNVEVTPSNDIDQSISTLSNVLNLIAPGLESSGGNNVNICRGFLKMLQTKSTLKFKPPVSSTECYGNATYSGGGDLCGSAKRFRGKVVHSFVTCKTSDNSYLKQHDSYLEDPRPT